MEWVRFWSRPDANPRGNDESLFWTGVNNFRDFLATALEEQRVGYVEQVEKINSVKTAIKSKVYDGWFDGYQDCKKEVLKILNKKEAK